ncbi:MAG TPA: YceI family protein [Gaiellaceae bacterium]|nr:YceI family protein [Gaiellaceae bacterium]
MSTTEQTTAVPTGTWSLDSVHSSIGFAVKHSGVMTFKGTFDEFDATLADGRLEGTAKVASVRVDDPNLAGHLQTPDFFDAEQFPELRFSSKEIARDGDTVSIEGELTLRGVAQPVELSGTISGPVTDGYGNQRVGLDLETTVNRRDYGINWSMELPSGEPGLADDVTITANLALVQA